MDTFLWLCSDFIQDGFSETGVYHMSLHILGGNNRWGVIVDRDEVC